MHQSEANDESCMFSELRREAQLAARALSLDLMNVLCHDGPREMLDTQAMEEVEIYKAHLRSLGRYTEEDGYGVYTMGEPWTAEQCEETLRIVESCKRAYWASVARYRVFCEERYNRERANTLPVVDCNWWE